MCSGWGSAPVGPEAETEGSTLWHWGQKALGSWGQRVTVLKCCPRMEAVRLLGGRDQRSVWVLGWEGWRWRLWRATPVSGVQEVGRVWHGLGACSVVPPGGVSSLPLGPCSKEVARYET